ncbi:hypothetical protein [Sphingobium sp. YR768]|uniref:hypothetical protein n=1 Tax=Sphingobium sp. YR768 TaxID=1884365 RepID=UPI0008B37D6C|nr:hypothetical protein [Sphingobium sp. YR768]SES19723.1 hypothetical protein SAMN05518866_1605 [Sphingobium sp. YR768]
MDYRAFLVALGCVALFGCSNTAPSYSQTDRINGLVESETRLQLRVDGLENKIAKMEREQLQDRQFSVDTFNALGSLRKTFNKNVGIENEEAVRDMTRRGACGAEWTQATDGQWFQTNKICTVSDLKK